MAFEAVPFLSRIYCIAMTDKWFAYRCMNSLNDLDDPKIPTFFVPCFLDDPKIPWYFVLYFFGRRPSPILGHHPIEDVSVELRDSPEFPQNDLRLSFPAQIYLVRSETASTVASSLFLVRSRVATHTPPSFVGNNSNRVLIQSPPDKNPQSPDKNPQWKLRYLLQLQNLAKHNHNKR